VLDDIALITELRAIVGDKYVLTGLERTRRFRTGSALARRTACKSRRAVARARGLCSGRHDRHHAGCGYPG
jgi:hypothetical protein